MAGTEANQKRSTIVYQMQVQVEEHNNDISVI